MLVEQGDSGAATNFTVTYEALDTIRSTFGNLTGHGAQDEVVAVAEVAGGGGAAAASSGSAVPGRIDSRADVVRAIEAIIDYYGRAEPASPVPIVLTRAKAWVSMDFMSVLSDIVPDSMREAKRILTLQDVDE